ncbi:beta-lactamase family protein [Actinocorallia sp. API 0066]|uniref:serine hydrolase domain-containing protein n=1 Tax=Actinocorallia sp. API 0066 TaxID=2896846 RepID=UPI001E600E6A|nr:serine hydrolase domain-containing protein [Actinocorallia sp. API 0066]MCD0449573.1 beta-lactamase family protein [Actinocorallia sp. API 0066]
MAGRAARVGAVVAVAALVVTAVAVVVWRVREATGPPPPADQRYACLLESASGDDHGALLRLEGPGIAYTGAAGVFAPGGRALRPGDPFRTASVTKAFTAVAALRLAERGVLGLDDPIGTHLDADLVARVAVWDGTSVAERITLRRLLDHTAGLYDYATDEEWLARVQDEPQRTWTARELVDWAVERGQPYFPPGEGFHYSDTGYVLVGMVIERVTGGSLADAYRTLVTEPLDLTATRLERPGAERVHAHAVIGGADTGDWNPTFDTHGGGGLVSTAEDLAAFLRAVITGDFLTEASRAAFLTTTPESDDSYALGLRRTDLDGDDAWYHTGFFGAFAGYVPSRDLTITGTATNADDQDTPAALMETAYRIATGSDDNPC